MLRAAPWGRRLPLGTAPAAERRGLGRGQRRESGWGKAWALWRQRSVARSARGRRR
jgi:hypothetical protein